jgi:hypothetical protein
MANASARSPQASHSYPPRIRLRLIDWELMENWLRSIAMRNGNCCLPFALALG